MKITGITLQIGGYTLPFVSTGGLLFLCAVGTFFVLPNSKDHSKDSELIQASRRGLLSILRIPSIALASLSVFCSATSIGFLAATLEPHIREVIRIKCLVALISILIVFS